jgi:hypothetical protein
MFGAGGVAAGGVWEKAAAASKANATRVIFI